jgi:hypothetical protein
MIEYLYKVFELGRRLHGDDSFVLELLMFLDVID